MKTIVTLLKLIMPASAIRQLGDRQEREIKLAIKELQSLSDRHLSDVGIARSEIETTVRFGRNQDRRSAFNA